MKRGDTIRIEWLDSAACSTSLWTDEETIDFDGYDKAMHYQSIGYFIRKTKISIYFCQSIRIDEDKGGPILGHLLSIPNRAVLSVKIIKGDKHG
jgi:hypothetical protein